MGTKPKLNQAETPTEIQSRDLFFTPNYATELLVPYIPKRITKVWEPACGIQKKISGVLHSRGYTTVSEDLYMGPESNFLESFPPARLDRSWAVITNPPYSIKNKFIQRAIELDVPFAFLIPFDMSGFLAKCFYEYSCQGLVPTRRIAYITPTGKQGSTSSPQFHSFWLTRDFELPNQLEFVDLTKEMMSNI